MMNMNENKFFETTTKDGKKAFVQINNIFYLLETETGCVIHSIGSPDNFIVSADSLDTIYEKIKQK